MTLDLTSYGGGLSDDMILGWITWYGISDAQITLEHLTETVFNAPGNLDATVILPKPPRMVDAFKRASRYSERKNFPIPGTSNKANVLIRKVSTQADAVENHMVLEVVNSEEKQLLYEVVTHFIFDRASNQLQVDHQPIDDEYVGIVHAMSDLFITEFEKAAKTIDPQVIRHKVRDQMAAMNAINVRSRASVYFVPRAAKSNLEGLEYVVNHLGGSSGMHSLPLLDDSKQREMVLNAFETDIHEKGVETIREIATHLEAGKKVRASQWSAWSGRLRDMREAAKEYRELLEVEMSAADLETEAIQLKLNRILNDDLLEL